MTAAIAELSFLQEPRNDCPPVLIVAPHPDDEIIGVGTRLPLLHNATVVKVTDGSPQGLNDAFAAGCRNREEYARLRTGETRAALALCGISQIIELNIPDQEAAHCLPQLSGGLREIIDELRPEFVMSVPYEGGHPDHDATAFAVHRACAQAARPPRIIEMLSYHNEAGRCVMDRFLDENADVLTIKLSEGDTEFKRRLFDCFRSQSKVLRWFPLQVEKFRFAPRYDFSKKPHAGQLYYEMFSWGLRGEEWCDLARDALGSERELAAA